MSRVDLSGRTVLVTGGTRGLGLAIGLELGRAGASVWLTHRWGSENEESIERLFLDAGAPLPEIVEADVGSPEDTVKLFDRLADRMARLDVLVSSAAAVSRGGSVDSLRLRDLRRTLDYSAWPLARYVDEAVRRFGTPPGRVIATSSDGAERHYPGYDYVALSKAVLEALCRKIGRPGSSSGCGSSSSSSSRVFVLRTRQIATGSYRDVFPERARGAAALAAFARFELRGEEVGSAAVAIASGLLDSLAGAGATVVTVDKGASFVDNVMTATMLLARHPASSGLAP